MNAVVTRARKSVSRAKGMPAQKAIAHAQDGELLEHIKTDLQRAHELLDECCENLKSVAANKSSQVVVDDAPAPDGSTLRTVKAAFASVSALLDSAHDTDEDHQWTGDSDRLLRIAVTVADLACGEKLTPANAPTTAFDIGALVRASRLVPGDGESPTRKALIDQAEQHLDWIADSTGTCTPDLQRPLLAPKPGQPQAKTPPHDASRDLLETAWYRAREAQEVVYACVMNYQGPETIWGVHTVLKVAVETLGGIVLDKQLTKDGCEDASNLLAQAIALTSMISETTNGEQWEMLRDASLALMVLAKDTLDQHREGLGYA
ncbi:MAG: hypothetical protein EOO27_27720 [Comamonadaceae bacterium]|nr:MAG: hypothetical protein EOO27_27720 [Comamonadaceae bacterium]